jgi:L-cysteate sulfo-lyase
VLLSDFPRVTLAHLPTPLEHLPRLSEHLGGPDIYVKRDDCTGLATGGNKTRKLEFLIADAQAQGVEVVITAGALQSNHARQTAAAAARVGMKCLLILENGLNSQDPLYLRNGNMLLDRLHGAQIQEVLAGADITAMMDSAVLEYARNNVKAYAIPIGGSNAIGALGYVDCALELAAQTQEMDFSFDHMVMATGSAGTQAGLIVGLKQAGFDLPVHGMCVSTVQDVQKAKVRALTLDILALIGIDVPLDDRDVIANSDYVGEGYAIPASSTIEAIKLVAETEGLLLDPVYSGKAMAGLIDYARKGKFHKDERVVFLHTGGPAALFAYENVFP